MVVTMLSVLFFLIANAESSQSFILAENSNKFYDFDWQCDTICLGSGGKASFDPENKICKCTLDKNTDEVDVLLMQKNAKNIGLQVITCEDYQKLEKRAIPNTENIENRAIVGLPKLNKFNIKNMNSQLRTSDKFNKLSLDSNKKFEFPTARKAKSSIGDSDAKQRFKEIQDKLKARMDSMTWKLPKLKQRTAFQSARKSEKSGKPLFDLSKIKKEEQQKWNLKFKNILGQPAPSIDEGKPGNRESARKLPALNKIGAHEDSQKPIDGKLPTKIIDTQAYNKNYPNLQSPNYYKHEIITQPPELYDSGDNSEDEDNK